MIYFVRCMDFVKIGHTGQIFYRFNQLQSENPCELELLFCLNGGIREESGWHLRFVKYHHRNEWFYLSGELLSFVNDQIDSIGNGTVTKPIPKRRHMNGNLSLRGLTVSERYALIKSGIGEP